MLQTAASFTEREPYERGFAEVFDNDIAPRLAELEAERQARHKQYRQRLSGAVIGLPLLALLIAYLGGVAILGFVFIGTILAGFLAARFVGQPKRGFRDALRAAVMPPVCRFFGEMQHAHGRSGTIGLSRFSQAGVVGSFNRASVDDVFTGRYREVGFAVAEAKLRRRGGGRNRSQSTVFRGLLVAVDVPKAFPGRILIGRDYGDIGNALAGWFKQFGGLQRVELPHGQFESMYAAYSDNPEAARAWLTPDFLENWVAVAEAYRGSAIRAAFAGSEFLAALPHSKNLFEAGALATPLDRIEEDLHRLLWEITIPHRLIDFLHGERPHAVV